MAMKISIIASLQEQPMHNKTKLAIAIMSTLVSSLTVNAEEQTSGFVEGSSLTVLNRNFYFNRDYRDHQSSPTGNGYSEAWSHGIISNFESGFTQGDRKSTR